MANEVIVAASFQRAMGVYVVIPIAIFVATVLVFEDVDRVDAPVEVFRVTRRQVLKKLCDRPTPGLRILFATLGFAIIEGSLYPGIEGNADLSPITTQARVERFGVRGTEDVGEVEIVLPGSTAVRGRRAREEQNAKTGDPHTEPTGA